MSRLSLSVGQKKKPTIKRSSVIKKLDKVFSQIIRSKGFCEHCGVSDRTLQCAHIYSRRHKNIRWDKENALCLCAGCHLFWWHHEPAEAIRWAMGIRDFDYLDKKVAESKPTKIGELLLILEGLENQFKQL